MNSSNDKVVPDNPQADFSDADERYYIVKTTRLHPDDPAIPDFWRARLAQQRRDDFDPGILTAIRDDPHLVPQLEALLAHAQQQFSSLIDQTMASMPKESVAAPTVKLSSTAVSGRRLMTGSRKVELAVKSRRELAEAFALEVVLNLGNPDWNPADPSTSKESPSALLALLR